MPHPLNPSPAQRPRWRPQVAALAALAAALLACAFVGAAHLFAAPWASGGQLGKPSWHECGNAGAKYGKMQDGTPCDAAGWSATNLIGGEALVYGGGPAFLLVGVCSRWLFTTQAGSRGLRAAVFGSVAAVFFALVQQSYSRWARPIARCLVLGCVTPPEGAAADDSDIVVQGLPGSVGMALLLVSLLAGSAHAALLFLTLRQPGSAEAEASHTPAPLLPSCRPGSCGWSLCAASVLLLLLPFLIVAGGVLPLWAAFTPDQIATYAAQAVNCSNPHELCPELPGAWFTTQTVELGEGVLLKLFPDVVIFYALIYLVLVVALLGRVVGPVHRALHYRPVSLRLLGHPTCGALLFGAALTLAVALNATYWFHDHNYHGDGPDHGHNRLASVRPANLFLKKKWIFYAEFLFSTGALGPHFRSGRVLPDGVGAASGLAQFGLDSADGCPVGGGGQCAPDRCVRLPRGDAGSLRLLLEAV